MAKRSKTYRVTCDEPGCREGAWFEYERVSESRVKDWLCGRHRRPDEVLSFDRSATVGTLTVEEKEYGKFWHDGERTGSGFVYGPGFRAWASDFLPGTKLVVRAVIEPAGGEVPNVD